MKRTGWTVAAAVAVGAMFVVLSGCGSNSGGLPPSSGGTGGGGSSTGANVTAITVGPGPQGSNYANTPFVTVRVCVPGSTSACQNIPDVLLDTGSYGLRLLSSVVNIALPETQNSSGNTLAECTEFEDSYAWGSVATADVYMGGSSNEGEAATGVPIQLIAPSGFPAAPSDCTQSGLTATNTVQTLGANGVLGVGPFTDDCGPACDPGSTDAPSPEPYYYCAGSDCTPTPLAESGQVQNPVWMFANDNNGIIVQLGAISAGGAASATGSLIFGLGTESNNSLGTATVLTVDDYGNISTTYNGVTYSDSGPSNYAGSFFDTGSNGLFVLDSATLGQGMADCAASGSAPGFYCPSSPINYTATNAGTNGNTKAAAFTIANAETLLGVTTDFAYDDLGGAFGSSTEAFDWGLPFFFGRTVYIAIDGEDTPAGTGPYFAY
ncbi:MAG: DUF3443 family protein [Terriglobales bacterium]